MNTLSANIAQSRSAIVKSAHVKKLSIHLNMKYERCVSSQSIVNLSIYPQVTADSKKMLQFWNDIEYVGCLVM